MPAYLFPPPSEADASIIDMDAIQEVCEVNMNIILKSFQVFQHFVSNLEI